MHKKRKLTHSSGGAVALSGDKLDEITKKCKYQPVLVRLDVYGVEPDPASRWAVVHPSDFITIVAVTDPPNTAVVWEGALIFAGNIALLSRVAVCIGQRVRAALGGVVREVELNVIDLLGTVTLGAELFQNGSGQWKAYECATPAGIAAVTNPPNAYAWDKLVWTNDAVRTHTCHASLQRNWPPAKANDSRVELRRATVTLGTIGPKTLSVDIRVCRWPVLRLDLVLFANSSVVANDGVAGKGQIFDRMWVPGRPQPAAGLAAVACQSLVCLVRARPVNLIARFVVTQAPTEVERVTVRASANVGGVAMTWTHAIAVEPDSTEIFFPVTASDQPLANRVAQESMLTITWTVDAPPQRHADGHLDPPVTVGTSENRLYVLLGPPAMGKPIYWTLLALSCQSADGTTTENAFVSAAFQAFTTTTGDGNGIRRKGDDVELSYYRDGAATRSTGDVYNTNGILHSVDGTGRCGGWQELLIDTFNMHGVAARGYSMRRRTWSGHANYGLRFLVNVYHFPAQAAGVAPYRSAGDIAHKQPGIAGQGKTNPQFDFGDHVTVLHNGQIYDPSYGVGPFATPALYEATAIAGFGIGFNGVAHTFHGTPQHVPNYVSQDCVYEMAYVSQANDTLTTIANQFGNDIAVIRARNPGVPSTVLALGTVIQVAISRADALVRRPQLNGEPDLTWAYC